VDGLGRDFLTAHGKSSPRAWIVAALSRELSSGRFAMLADTGDVGMSISGDLPYTGFYSRAKGFARDLLARAQQPST